MAGRDPDKPIRQLDVRPILARGQEPFGPITETVRALPPGTCLRLIAPFRPTPLFSVMARMGFVADPRQRPDGVWEVLFSPLPQPDPAQPDPAQSDPAQPDLTEPVPAELGLTAGSAPEAMFWPDPLHSLDLTGRPPPLASARILSMLARMQAGRVLFALLDAEPGELIPDLAGRGHEWAGNHSADRSCYRLMIRCGTSD